MSEANEGTEKLAAAFGQPRLDNIKLFILAKAPELNIQDEESWHSSIDIVLDPNGDISPEFRQWLKELDSDKMERLDNHGISRKIADMKQAQNDQDWMIRLRQVAWWHIDNANEDFGESA